MWVAMLWGCAGVPACEVVSLEEGCPVEQCCDSEECWLEVESRRYVCDIDGAGADCSRASDEARAAECGSGPTGGPTGDTGEDLYDCPWVGAWSVADASCGASSFAALTWGEVFVSATPVGCELRIEATVDGCVHAETVYVDMDRVGPPVATTDSGTGSEQTCALKGQAAALGDVEHAWFGEQLNLTFDAALWLMSESCVGPTGLHLAPQ